MDCRPEVARLTCDVDDCTCNGRANFLYNFIHPGLPLKTVEVADEPALESKEILFFFEVRELRFDRFERVVDFVEFLDRFADPDLPEVDPLRFLFREEVARWPVGIEAGVAVRGDDVVFRSVARWPPSLQPNFAPRRPAKMYPSVPPDKWPAYFL